MDPWQQRNKYRENGDMVFILMLLCLFAFGSLLLVVYGANIYQGINQQAVANDQTRTPLAYVAAKVRQYDQSDSVRLVDKEGRTALVLETLDGNQRCETWLYTYENDLYEVYVDQGAVFSLADGNIIIEDCQLEMTLEHGLLTMTAVDAWDEHKRLSLALRSDEEGGDKQ